ncbi:putative Rpf-interacting protein [Rhodococcus sp. AW25M09]|uniref:NlpC/P60 family protein n=1 Tax=Rhodococcus sp. AW25M09 TaxID=1268303 RepID=UPI0002AC9F05|nr:NlpC/P60 family protein [Rhodococcus sp. AW25M09]CCQ16542.1 putative Rpf-interacting protein [Rhodococcus sp. AW25M09]
MSRRPVRGIRRRALVRTRFVLVGAGLVLALTAALPGVAAAVPPPPPNPSDNDLAAAGSAVDSRLGQVGQLIDSIASANQQLAQLDDEVASKREGVNKALVDLQNARDAADVAAAVVSAAQQALADAGTQIQAAQRKFDEFAKSSYTQGSGVASMASFLGSSGPDDILDRAQVLKVLSNSQNAVLDGLQRARTEQANRDSAARDSKQQADAAASEAETKKAEAEQAIAEAQAALQAEADRKAAIESARDAAQTELDIARTDVAGLQDQRAAYGDWENQKAAEDAAVAAATAAAREAAVQAAARVSANLAAQQRAAAIAEGQRSHVDVDDDSSATTDSNSSTGTTPVTPTKPSTSKPSPTKPKTSTTPSVTGSAAVELAIDRGMSQLGVPYSWGGGDENGPTKGIRDGGVADSYGDYNKVGFDCSGLMIYAFAGLGISLPHYTGYQYTAGKQVPSSDMKRGDMIFYGPNASQHVALYLGNGKMLEAPQSGSVVKVSDVRYSGMTPYAVRMVS